MDASGGTPPIPSSRQQQQREHQRQRKRGKSPEAVNLPPLTAPFVSGDRQRSSCRKEHSNCTGTGVQRKTGEEPARIFKRSASRKTRPYRVLESGATSLMHACQQADLSRVLRLLKEEEETLGYRDRTLRTTLHYCMDAGTGGAVASAAPELLDAPDAEGHTPLHLAVIAGDARLVAVLLANGANVNAKDSEGHGVLHWATVCGEAECARLVLAAGARPSTPDLRGGSPLHYAAQCCGAAALTSRLSVPKKIGLRVLETLLEFGANVDAKDEDGRQPILWAASAGSVEAVLLLARAGGSAAAGATDKDGLTALHCAASRGHARCVEALVNLCGCHPDHVDENGCSALHYAATLGHADATALLLKLGADPNRQDRKGRTPALCAAAKGQLETLKILAQHGGSLHARTIRGTGVAHEAVLSGRTELVEWLGKRRPSTLDVATHEGKTPLHVAALHGYLDVCKVLLDHGARTNAVLRTSKSGPMTALDAALYRGHRDCAKLVQMHGGTSARHLDTLKTPATNRVFAAKLRVRENDSGSDESTESACSEPRRNRTHSGERWIEKKTQRGRRGRAGGSDDGFRGKTSKNDPAGAGSLSEDQAEIDKCSRDCHRDYCQRHQHQHQHHHHHHRHRRHHHGRCPRRRSRRRPDRTHAHRDFGRRAMSESSRYNFEGPEYRESWSDANKYSTNEEEREKKIGKRSRRRTTGVPSEVDREKGFGSGGSSSSSSSRSRGSSGSERRDRDHRSREENSSDDSLEVIVVVKKLLEKTSEKVQITGNKLKTPRETLRKTRVREETQRSRKRSRTSLKNVPTGSTRNEASEKTEEQQRRLEEKEGEPGEQTGSERCFEEQRYVGEDVTTEESTSQETAVERVTVTALVHDERVPETPEHRAELPVPVESPKAKDEREKDSLRRETSIVDSSRDTQIHADQRNSDVSEGSETTSAAIVDNSEISSSATEETASSERKTGENDRETVRTETDAEAKPAGQDDTRNRRTAVTETPPEGQDNHRDPDEPDERDDRGDREAREKSTEEKIVRVEPSGREESGAGEEPADQPGQKAPSTDTEGTDLPKEHTGYPIGINEGLTEGRPFLGSPEEEHRSGGSSTGGKSSRADHSAIVAVIGSPEWDDREAEREIFGVTAGGNDEDDEDDDPETAESDTNDGSGVFRILPSTSEEETPIRIPTGVPPKTDERSLPKIEERLTGRERRLRSDDPESVEPGSSGATMRKGRGAEQRRDSGGRDSGIEPSPRVSKIPKRTVRYRPDTEKQRALDAETVTRDVQINLRRYHLERKIFFQLMELKRLQIRHGRANERVLVKRQVDTFHRAGTSGPALGVAKYDQPLTFRHFEAFLYEQLRRLQRRPATPDFCTEAKQCTQKTHRCHHATSAYTSVPVYTYLGGSGGGTTGEGYHEEVVNREPLLPRIESRRGRARMTVRVTGEAEKRVISLPPERSDRTKHYYVTFTVRGEPQEHHRREEVSNDAGGALFSPASRRIEHSRNKIERNAKSV